LPASKNRNRLEKDSAVVNCVFIILHADVSMILTHIYIIINVDRQANSTIF
jgi:hypothetical protein